jgi:hypothetical protein
MIFRDAGMFGIWSQLNRFVDSPTEIANFLPKLFNNSARRKRSPDVKRLSENRSFQSWDSSKSDISKSMVEQSLSKNGSFQSWDSSKTDISKSMVEQSLLASILFLEFWNETILPVIEENNFNEEHFYLFHFCEIQKSLNRIGPWAVLIGKSMLRGLTKFVDNNQLSDAILKFGNWNEFDKNCKIFL